MDARCWSELDPNEKRLQNCKNVYFPPPTLKNVYFSPIDWKNVYFRPGSNNHIWPLTCPLMPY